MFLQGLMTILAADDVNFSHHFFKHTLLISSYRFLSTFLVDSNQVIKIVSLE